MFGANPQEPLRRRFSPFTGGGFYQSLLASSEPFVPAWGLTVDTSLHDATLCRDMMINHAPPSVCAEQEDLTDDQALRRGWFELSRGSLAQADMLRRFEHLSYNYAGLYKAHS